MIIVTLDAIIRYIGLPLYQLKRRRRHEKFLVFYQTQMYVFKGIYIMTCFWT